MDVRINMQEIYDIIGWLGVCLYILISMYKSKKVEDELKLVKERLDFLEKKPKE